MHAYQVYHTSKHEIPHAAIKTRVIIPPSSTYSRVCAWVHEKKGNEATLAIISELKTNHQVPGTSICAEYSVVLVAGWDFCQILNEAFFFSVFNLISVTPPCLGLEKKSGLSKLIFFVYPWPVVCGACCVVHHTRPHITSTTTSSTGQFVTAPGCALNCIKYEYVCTR